MNGLGCVFQQIEQHLLQFVGNAWDRSQLWVELTNNGVALKVKAQREVKVIVGNIHRLFDKCRQVAGAHLAIATPAEAEHMGDEIFGPGSLIVACKNEDEMLAVAEHLSGGQVKDCR